MRKVTVALLAILTSFSLCCARSTAVASIPTSVIAQPQTKCENGLTSIQFEGAPGWFQTSRKCDVHATPVRLDTTFASSNLTQAQLDTLLRSYLSDNPTPHAQDINVCCCQPGWQVYDNSFKKCVNGKVIDK